MALTDVIGALGLAGGDDARLYATPDTHRVSLYPGEAVFFVDPAELTLPPILVGDSSTATVTLANVGGTVPLVVDSIATLNPLFTVAPDSVVVPPDSAIVLSVRFAPTDSAFGAQAAALVFHHNGTSRTDTLRVSAVGLGGRGDVAVDGVVDVVDLVQALDFVLLRAAPDSLQRASGDQFPFPGGDGSLDVRDLTVLSHAIVNGFWPDSIALPALDLESTVVQSLLATTGDTDDDRLLLEQTWTLALETDVPVRALQAVLAAEHVAQVRTVADAGNAPVVTLFTRSENEIRVLSYRTDGGMLEAGTYKLLEVEPEEEGGRVRPLYVIGVDEDLERVSVTVAGVVEEDAESEVPGDILRLGVPYPNPVQFTGGKRLRLPLVGRPSDGRGRAAVFNILGQRVRLLDVPPEGERDVEWDGRDQRAGLVAPGIYFIRLENAEGPVRSVVVVR